MPAVHDNHAGRNQKTADNQNDERHHERRIDWIRGRARALRVDTYALLRGIEAGKPRRRDTARPDETLAIGKIASTRQRAPLVGTGESRAISVARAGKSGHVGGMEGEIESTCEDQGSL